jgi:hypothetical protein
MSTAGVYDAAGGPTSRESVNMDASISSACSIKAQLCICHNYCHQYTHKIVLSDTDTGEQLCYSCKGIMNHYARVRRARTKLCALPPTHLRARIIARAHITISQQHCVCFCLFCVHRRSSGGKKATGLGPLSCFFYVLCPTTSVLCISLILSEPGHAFVRVISIISIL